MPGRSIWAPAPSLSRTNLEVSRSDAKWHSEQSLIPHVLRAGKVALLLSSFFLLSLGGRDDLAHFGHAP